MPIYFRRKLTNLVKYNQLRNISTQLNISRLQQKFFIPVVKEVLHISCI
ncbi:hypothetical protein NWP17_10600 [Chrysosporum bergii ANA360D]|uniref:Uncharacterized protein n=1 Tax=Chrysosporum bergii ANA360D TaxID=617107 RepID=A0AA43KCG8_9CYAN|nr:hypothetical protein [Chrysosporum bergii]MDH6060883.1 hypothetical protein [Chrysosporum bergii ANA360D]